VPIETSITATYTHFGSCTQLHFSDAKRSLISDYTCYVRPDNGCPKAQHNAVLVCRTYFFVFARFGEEL
jgi:hypothetical protein